MIGMEIPMIKSRASNIPMTKGIMYVVIMVLMSLEATLVFPQRGRDDVAQRR